MKLVEILAKEMDVWPRGAKNMTQDNDGGVSPCTDPNNDLSFNGSSWTSSDGFQMGINILGAQNLAEDHATAIVTREMWQAERDRQKGCEWKRHRGGKCPVPAGTKVSTRHRDGEVVDVHFHTAEHGTHKAVMDCVWKHDGSKHDIMAYKVISQPQAEEVEAKRNAAKDVDVEYAFGAPGADMSNLDWKPMGKCKVSNIEFDSAEMEEERVKDTTVGTLTYKVEIDTGPAMQALNELSAKWDQVETPFKWRDEVTELNAYIEKYTRERDELINRLASEGFALIPAMHPVMGVADIDFSDWRNWKAGDVVECLTGDYSGTYTKGKQYIVEWVEDEVFSVFDDHGEDSSCDWFDDDAEVLKFIRRP